MHDGKDAHWGVADGVGGITSAPPPYVPPEAGGCGGRVLRDEAGQPRPCASPGCLHAAGEYLEVTDEFVCPCHAPVGPAPTTQA